MNGSFLSELLGGGGVLFLASRTVHISGRTGTCAGSSSERRASSAESRSAFSSSFFRA